MDKRCADIKKTTLLITGDDLIEQILLTTSRFNRSRSDLIPTTLLAQENMLITMGRIWGAIDHEAITIRMILKKDLITMRKMGSAMS